MQKACLGFMLGLIAAVVVNHLVQVPQPIYALNSDGCVAAGLKATGWSMSQKYKGGLEEGGITMATEYECK